MHQVINLLMAARDLGLMMTIFKIRIYTTINGIGGKLRSESDKDSV